MWRGEYVVVNTCGFIADAKEESINLLLSLAELKDSGKIGKIVAMGCLTQRYRDVLDKEIPEIDIVYGKFDWKNFIDSLEDRSGAPAPREWERTLTTPPHSCYIKISRRLRPLLRLLRHTSDNRKTHLPAHGGNT